MQHAGSLLRHANSLVVACRLSHGDVQGPEHMDSVVHCRQAQKLLCRLSCPHSMWDLRSLARD